MYGEPDVIEVRQVFETTKEARIFEEMIIDDLEAVKDARWLNRTNRGKDFCIDAPLSVEHRKKISESQLGRVLSDDHRKKLSTAKMGRSLSKNTVRRSLLEIWAEFFPLIPVR